MNTFKYVIFNIKLFTFIIIPQVDKFVRTLSHSFSKIVSFGFCSSALVLMAILKFRKLSIISLTCRFSVVDIVDREMPSFERIFKT